jgi:hypothetical protein
MATNTALDFRLLETLSRVFLNTLEGELSPRLEDRLNRLEAHRWVDREASGRAMAPDRAC